MAELYVRHSLSSKVAVKFNVSIKQFTIKGVDGDPKWLLEVATTYLDEDGYNIRPKLVHLRTLDNIDEEIELAISEMCDVIDWGILEEDEIVPYVFEYEPEGNSVSIGSNITFTIKDMLPSSGIDISEIKITLNNGTTSFDITDEVSIAGDPYEYKFRWFPEMRVHERYGD